MERRVVGLDLAEGFEGPEVVLAAGLEADVLEVRGVGDDGLEDVAEHRAVDLAVLGLSGAVDPGDVEDVGDVGQWGELGLGVGGIGYVALDVFDGVVEGPVGAGAAGDAVDLPRAAGGVGEREDLGEAVADDAGDADYEGHALVLGRAFVFIQLLLWKERDREIKG